VPRPDQQDRSSRPPRGYILLEEDEKTGGLGLWRLLFALLLLVATVGGGLALYLTPVLRVQVVEVTGAQTLDAYSLVEMSDLKGHSMFTAPLDEAQQRLAALPLVKSARAERRWPHTVRLVIQERQPWGYWYTQDKEYVVDADGVILEGAMPAPDAPIIYQQDSSGQFQPGGAVDPDAVRLAQDLMESLPATLDLAVARLEYNNREGLSLVADAGYRVVFGDSHGFEFKLAVWQALEQRLGRQEIEGHVLDLRFGDRPSLR
jgi:cell division protein FtsQ